MVISVNAPPISAAKNADEWGRQARDDCSLSQLP